MFEIFACRRSAFLFSSSLSTTGKWEYFLDFSSRCRRNSSSSGACCDRAAVPELFFLGLPSLGGFGLLGAECFPKDPVVWAVLGFFPEVVLVGSLGTLLEG